MDPDVPLALLLTVIVAFAAIRISGRKQFAVVYWVWSWTVMLSAGAVRASSPGIALTALAYLAATAFAPLQVAGAYTCRGEARA